MSSRQVRRISIHLLGRSEEIRYLIPSLIPLSLVPYFSEAVFNLVCASSTALMKKKGNG